MQLTGFIQPSAMYLVFNPGVAGVSQTFPDNTLQNGPDAVSVLAMDASNVPFGTRVTDVYMNSITAVVYIRDDEIVGLNKNGTPGEELLRLSEAADGSVYDEVPSVFELTRITRTRSIRRQTSYSACRSGWMSG